MPKKILCARLATLMLCFLGRLPLVVSGAETENWTPKQIEYFEKHIRPVLIERCYECHAEGAESLKGNLRVDHRDGLLLGGDSGAAVVPGNAEASLILKSLRYEDLEMPPEEKLPDEVIARFERWIRMGAPDPRKLSPLKTPERQPAEALAFWSFQPPMPVSPPSLQESAWAISEIDHFVKAKLEAEGLKPVADADPQALIRRAYFDLWGVPPEPAAIEQFVKDPSPDAFAKIVDQLLESPHFGERWGRHWLDVARYGESTGNERNFLYPHAWRYRDYVINAFNKDKPYDQFVTEQIAGDLLGFESQAQRDEQHIATGFLAIGSRNLLGGDTPFVFDTIDDQINVTTQAFLGMTVSCARCHDHKFDPVSTEEYYALAGIFMSTEALYGTKPGTGNGVNRHPSDLIPLGEAGLEQHQAVEVYDKKFADLQKELEKVENVVKKLTALPEAKLAEKQSELDNAKEEVRRVKAEIEELKRQQPPMPAYAMGVREAKKITDTEVRLSGEAGKKGAVVPRGVLACCAQTKPEIPQNASGRLELARWLVNADNTLTARVMVNRIWHHLMGRGIVPSVDNFGHNGQMPTHPELLDWLATEFRNDNWSIKQLIRRIMLSRTYQLSTVHNADNFERDPDNKFLWRASPKRLDAEAIRDALLAASGSLRTGAPDFGSVIAKLGDGCLVRQIDAEKLDAHDDYRSVYLPVARFFEPESLQVFDAASASLVMGDRPETNVPAQMLYLLNNAFVIQQARVTAERLEHCSPGNTEEKIRLAYQLILSRRPTQSELERAVAYVQPKQDAVDAASTAKTDPNHDNAEIWASFVQALFAGAEFRFVY